MNSTIYPGRRPSDRVYSCIHWTFLGLIALILLHGLVLSRFIRTPQDCGFRLVLLLVFSFNALWWSVADRRFARYIASPKLSFVLRAVVTVFSAVLNTPVVWMIWKAKFPAALQVGPTWYSAAIMIWHLSLSAMLPIVAGTRLMYLGAGRVIRTRRETSERVTVAPAPVDLGRRAVLKTAFASAPMILLTGATIGARSQEGRLQVNRRKLPAPWLPDRLKGLTITHITDMHLGRHFRPQRLPHLVEEVNKLKSDLIVVTGDVVDVSNEYLPDALRAFEQFEHRYGMFGCIGNHDEIDDRNDYIRLTRQTMPLLIDQRMRLQIAGEPLTIAGVDYARFQSKRNLRWGHAEHVEKMMRGYDAEIDGPVIAMAHHPHAWDFLAMHGVPLTLSGHTHGGQLMFTPPDARPDLGLGQFLFRYVRGFYTQAGGTLFVNRGVGDWFPLRMHSPNEIVQIQLV